MQYGLSTALILQPSPFGALRATQNIQQDIKLQMKGIKNVGFQGGLKIVCIVKGMTAEACYI